MITDFLLSSYGEMLRTALEAKYEFVPYGEIGKEGPAATCLLRHDVDAELFQCGAMAELEAELGIRATYFLMTRSTTYNLFSIEGLRMVEKLLASGHDIGLHFMGELHEAGSAQELAAAVKEEAGWLGREFGRRIQAVSFHQPTRAILEGDVRIEGMRNTYSKTDMRDYFYVSDTNMQWRQEHPTAIFSRRLHRRLQLLVHPIWWTEKQLTVPAKWAHALRGHQEAVLTHWEKRERTLAEPGARTELRNLLRGHDR